jgi:hypothetical protein
MVGAGGNSAFEAVCTLTPRLWFLCERKEEVWARNGRSNLARQSDFHVIAGFFNMPQSCDVGQMALLPL